MLILGIVDEISQHSNIPSITISPSTECFTDLELTESKWHEQENNGENISNVEKCAEKEKSDSRNKNGIATDDNVQSFEYETTNKKQDDTPIATVTSLFEIGQDTDSLPGACLHLKLIPESA